MFETFYTNMNLLFVNLRRKQILTNTHSACFALPCVGRLGWLRILEILSEKNTIFKLINIMYGNAIKTDLYNPR